ncbi:MAG TPA: ATP-binding protein [Streptosporangiaceae bacterium]|nr:ATP-binding protein [Streptosporangiaceae bacterium]
MAGDLRGSDAALAGPGVEGGECRAFSMTLPVHELAARLARQATHDTLGSWGLSHLEETATLLVSELVSNAVRHAATGLVVELALEAGGRWLRIEVADADPHPPLPRAPAALDESGFGFVLIEALADKWGVRETATGKGVWAELDSDIAVKHGPVRGCIPAIQPTARTSGPCPDHDLQGGQEVADGG